MSEILVWTLFILIVLIILFLVSVLPNWLLFTLALYHVIKIYLNKNKDE
jgi:hypothetical protein